MPNDTYHVTANENSFVQIGDNYQSVDAKHEKLLNRLFPSWQSNKSLELYWDHNQARKKHVGETHEWMFGLVEFQSWILETNGVIWLHGRTGCGKTVLSSTIIEHLRSCLPRETNHIAGYYFNAREDEKRTVDRLMRSVLLQLLPNKGDLPPQVEQLSNETSQNVSEHQLLMALEELIGGKDHTYIVIDALDECDATYRSGEDSEVDKLYKFIQFLIEKSRNLHLLVTSRDGGLASELETILSKMTRSNQDNVPHHEFDLESIKMKDRIGNDIRELVTSEVKRWNDRKGRRRWLPLNDDQQKLVNESVQKRANGMFRLAACLLDLLWRKDSWEELQLALNDLPSEIFDVYDRIFEEINDQGQLTTANTLLKWILYSERPLSLTELIELTMVDDQGTSFSIGHRAQDKSYVSLTLSSFVIISEDDLVQFPHQTVQEYLLSDKVQCGLFSHQRECNIWIIRCCLSYMEFCNGNLESVKVTQQEVGEIFPLFEYVFNNWYSHFLKILQNEEVSGRVLLSSNNRTGVSLRTIESVPDSEDSQSLLSQWIVASNSWLDQVASLQDSSHSSVLRDVACQGYERCIRFIFTIFNLVPVASSDPYSRQFVLKAAIAGRYKEMIQILVNGHFQGGWNKKSWWTVTGHNEERKILEHKSHRVIMQVLLSHRVNANLVDTEDGWTPLHMAAFQGDEKMMDVLLRYGARPCATDFDGRTPLHVASYMGHDAIVKLWLDKRLPVDTKDNMGWKALDRALYRAATEMTVQHLPAASRELHDSFDAIYNGTPAIPQVLESNGSTIARTIDLLLKSGVPNEEIHVDKPLSADQKPTESALSDKSHSTSTEEDHSTSFSGSSASDHRISLIRPVTEMTVEGGHVKVGLPIMENVITGLISGPWFTTMLSEFPLRKWPTILPMNKVDRLRIHDGVVDLTRCLLLMLVVCGGTVSLNMSHVEILHVLRGSTVFSSPPRIREFILNGGTILFRDCYSTSPEISHSTVFELSQAQQKMADGFSQVSTAVQLGQFVVYEGSATFLAPAQVNELRIHGGTVSFSSIVNLEHVVIYHGSISFSEESHINDLVIHEGFVEFLTPTQLDQLVVYRGTAAFSSMVKVKEFILYGGSVTFSSVLELEQVVLYGGSVTFCEESHFDTMVIYNGYFNSLSKLECQEVVLYRGCAIFAARCSIANMVVHGGHSSFLSAADIDQVVQYGGRIDFLQRVHQELLEIIYDGANLEKTVDGTRAPVAVYIQGGVIHGGIINFFCIREVKHMVCHGGIITSCSDGAMCTLASSGQVDLARTLLKQGCSPVVVSPGPRQLALNGGQNMEVYGWTAVHEAAYRGQEAFIQMLLEEGVDVLLQDDNMPTALDIAVLQRHTAIVQLLTAVCTPAFRSGRVMLGAQQVLQRYSQGIYDVFRSLVG